MFEDFRQEMIDVGDATIAVRHGSGGGTPVLLLHGHPRTSATWHRVAPMLVESGFDVVCPDLRGYGRSVGPPASPDHSAHCKRAVAGDLARVMTRLGHERFMVVGHDRGSYVALRLALDEPGRVGGLAVLDGIPLSEHVARADRRFARDWWHWFFFAQPELPERAILADPESWYPGDPEVMGVDNHHEMREATRRPEVVRAMLEDYRAGLTIDLEHERADRDAGRRVAAPVLALWSARDDLATLHGDPRSIWRSWADDVTGGPIDSGHHVAEEAPDELVDALTPFFQRCARRYLT